MNPERLKAAHRTRRIIMNNDGGEFRRETLNSDGSKKKASENFTRIPEEKITPEAFLRERTSPLLRSHVDSIFYSTGVFGLYTHQSNEADFFDDRPDKRWARELIQQGRDTLQIMIDHCRQNNLEIFWSMRMNDTNEHKYTKDYPKFFPPWKVAHPECLMGFPGEKLPFGGGCWSAVNYDLPEVREKVFRILHDVCTRYDVDGVELDFMRHHHFFKAQMIGEPVTQEHCDLMTDLLVRIRSMTEEVGRKRGRPFLISIRVMDSVDYAKAIGLDVVRWLKEDLVDVIAANCYFHLDPWEKIISLGKSHDVPVYICLSASRLCDGIKGIVDVVKGDIKLWRGQALQAWEAGASGIYTFNRFDPHDPIFRELGDPQVLQKLEHIKKYVMGNLGWINFLKDGYKYRTMP